MSENEKKYREKLEEMVEKRTAELKQEIAERKNAEKKLLESEMGFRDLFENMMDGLVLHRLIVDENGNPVDYILEKMNAAAEKILSCKRENIEGKRATEVYNGDTPFIERYAKVAQTGKSKCFRDYYPGFRKWYEIMSFCPEKGHFANVFRDITEQKRVEDELRNSEEKYRILTETAPDIIFTLDRKGKFTYISPGFENVAGYSSREFLGHNFTEMLAPEHIDTMKDRFKRGLSGEKFPITEVEIMHKDGRKIPVECNVTSLFDEDGNIIGRLGVARDITESKQIQKVLRESESRYRTIFENTGTAIVIVEEDKTISLANAEFERLSGYSRKEIEGKKRWTEFVVEEDLEKMKGYHEQRRVDPTSAPKRYEFRLIDKKGSARNILLSIDVIPGTKISVASLLDITEPKKAEEQIKASLREKEVLLQEIHHRVKNNMQIVISLLRLQSAKVKDKKIKEVFRECQNRIRTMALIHDKLYQSKDLAKINFAHYIDGLVVHTCHSYGVDSNIIALKTDLEEVFLDLNRAIPCGLIANELLSNSIKHAFPQGEQGEICVGLHSDKKGMITLVVSDNGTGFPKDIDFRKAQSLGLQMVNDLTKQINGTIKLDRTGGTAFKIEFSVNK